LARIGVAGAGDAARALAAAGFAVKRAGDLDAALAAAFGAGFAAARDLVTGDARFAALAGALFLLDPALLGLLEAAPRAPRPACDRALLFAAVDDFVLVGIIPPGG
jgi:hypothetical protein